MESLQQRPEGLFLKWASYIRYPFSFFSVFLLFAICSIVMVGACFFRIKPLERAIAFWWGRLSCGLFGVKTVVSGEENLPEGGCLFLFNHSSHFDIPIIYGNVHKAVQFGAKAELFRIPFMGMALRSMGALPIHRGKRSEVLKLYEQSVPRIEKGESFALAPEGTRQNQARLGSFKTGPFIFSVKANAPVVPVVLKGALEILPKGHMLVNQGRWRRRVILKFLPPIYPQSVDMDIDRLKELTREKMEIAFSESQLPE